jgi:hypothetical protein
MWTVSTTRESAVPANGVSICVSPHSLLDFLPLEQNKCKAYRPHLIFQEHQLQTSTRKNKVHKYVLNPKP